MNLLPPLIFTLLLLAGVSSQRATEDSLTKLVARFVANVAEVSSKEINLVVKKHNERDLDSRKLIKEVDKANKKAMGAQVPIAVHDRDWLHEALLSAPEEPCPIFHTYGNVTELTHENKLYERTKLPAFQQSKLLIFWVDSKADLEVVFELAHLSFLNCTQKKDYGAFGPNSVIAFLSTSMSLIEEALNFQLLFNHPQMLGLEVTTQGTTHLKVWQRPPQRAWKKLNLNFVITSNSSFSNMKQIIVQPTNFGGEEIIGSTNNLNYNDQLTPHGLLPRQLWRQAFYQTQIFYVVEDHFNVHMAKRPTPTPSTGFVDDEGNLIGDQFLISYNLVDIAMTSNWHFYNSQVSSVCPVFLLPMRFITFAAPLPKPLPTSLALILPFEPSMWLIFMASLLICFLAFAAISHLYFKVHSKTIFYGNGHLAWFGIASIFRQDLQMLSGQNQWKSNALRWCLLLWLLFVFVVTAGYCGNLRSFLINPGYERPIETASDIVESGLPIRWYRNEASLERIFSLSKDKDHQKIWKKHTPLWTGQGLIINDHVKGVLEGKYILVTSNLMQRVVRAAYTTPNGKEMVYVSKEPLLEATKARRIALFPILSRWSQLFNRIFRQIEENGVMLHINDINLDLIKVVYKARGLVYDFRSFDNVKMNLGLEEMQGIFLLALALIALSIIMFALELGYFKVKKARGAAEKPSVTQIEEF